MKLFEGKAIPIGAPDKSTRLLVWAATVDEAAELAGQAWEASTPQPRPLVQVLINNQPLAERTFEARGVFAETRKPS